jgi:hypothetical protein
VSAAVLAFTPSHVLAVVSDAPWETELLRLGGSLLFVHALLIVHITRKGIVDDRRRRLLLAGDLVVVLAALYVFTGNPFFLVVGFSVLLALTLRTMMPALDHWSREVRARYER